MSTVLESDFFDRPTLAVAKDLIGKYLCRKIGKKTICLMITEVEAYFGSNDLASKGRRGKTPGNLPMFMGPGTIYVYFTYGMHWLLNIVTEREEYPAAVLIRALQAPAVPEKRVRLGLAARSALFDGTAGAKLNGPAKLTKYLKINKSLNGKKLSRETGLWVEDGGVAVSNNKIVRTPRIGIPNAGAYVHKPWRFVLKP